MDPGPRALPGRVGGGRSADSGLRRPAGDAAHPAERDGRADRRGGRPATEQRGDRSRWASAPAADRAAPTPMSDRTTERDSSPIRAACERAGGGAAADRAPAVFALSEAGGALVDLSPVAAGSRAAVPRRAAPRGPARRVVGALRVAHPRRAARAPLGHRRRCWSSPTGSTPTASRSRRARPRWDHRSATPIIALLGSPRLAHVIVQSELETFAIEPDGTVAWRVAHSDVVTAADLRRRPARADQLRWPGPRPRSRRPGGRPTDASRPDCGRTVDNSADRDQDGGRIGLTGPWRPLPFDHSPERPSDTNG